MKMNHRRSGSNAASGCWLAVACAAIGLTSTGVRAGEDPFVASPIVAPFEMRQLDAAGSGDLVSPVYLQNIVNPADKMASRSRDSATRPTDDPRRPENPFANRMSSYEMPAVEVVGEKLPELREEDKIGPYAQPRWTARRFTPGTRVYVRPPGTIEFEYWLRPTIGKDGNTEIRTLYEVGIGLPYRFQIDAYLRTDSDGDGGETEVGQQLELRWAIADWNVIWGNPTLYLEWVQHDSSPDQIEAKVLFGGEIAPRIHWGVNLVAELELGGEREYEYSLTGGVTYALYDSLFSVGGEFIAAVTSTSENRDSYETSILVGPTVQWRPFEQLRVAFSPLVGLTPESPDFRAYLNVGWEF